jgi:hypothetical protein
MATIPPDHSNARRRCHVLRSVSPRSSGTGRHAYLQDVSHHYRYGDFVQCTTEPDRLLRWIRRGRAHVGRGGCGYHMGQARRQVGQTALHDLGTSASFTGGADDRIQYKGLASRTLACNP